MIIGFSSPGARANIAQLNSWFYNGFGKTLYQDIHIHRAIQLFQLFLCPKAALNLAETRKLTINRLILWETGWHRSTHGWLDGPADVLGRLLQMTSSLHEFRIEERSPSRIPLSDLGPERLFTSEINRRASDPSFLPHLARIQSPMIWSCMPLFRGRPIEYLSDMNQESALTVNRPATRFHPAGVSPTRVSVNITVSRILGGFKCAHEVATTFRDVSLQGITVKHLRVVVVELVVSSVTPPVDLPAWVKAMTSKNGHEDLESLCIIFDTPCPRKPMDVQLQTLNQAVDRMPNLTYAILGSTDVEWRRHLEEQSESPSRVPDWTPRPRHSDPDVLSWWLETLQPCDAVKARKGDLEGVGQLRDYMLARWDEALVPSIEELRTGLLEMTSSSVQG
ncbi:hypothetical protein FRC08_017994 [Ceratobasidium sp. 394]|nr:hypothetical protein FRC08_017994 [Ceratobasidium sp. 394]